MSELVVTALGCHSAVGCGVDPTCAAIRAGIAGFRSYEEFAALAPDFAEAAPPDPIHYAPAPGLPARAGLERRLGALAAKAVADLARTSRLTRAGFRGTHLFLALPENSREGVAPVDAERLAQSLCKGSSLVFRADQRAFPEGHVASLVAVEQARRLVAEEPAARCLVVAVDSNVPDTNLEWLDRSWRLKSQRNVDGFIPGEAGVALLLEGPAEAARRGAFALGRISATGVGDEPNASCAEVHSTASGLTAAIRAAYPEAEKDPLRWVICDLNGESYRGREWGVAVTRLARRFEAPVLWHPAESTGDVGAASGALHIAVAARAFARRYAPADRALVWCASDSPRRAACVVSAPVDRARSR